MELCRLKCSVLGFVLQRPFSGCAGENEEQFCAVCVSFVCLRQNFQMAKEDKLRFIFF